jgi:hypothetical protein
MVDVSFDYPYDYEKCEYEYEESLDCLRLGHVGELKEQLDELDSVRGEGRVQLAVGVHLYNWLGQYALHVRESFKPFMAMISAITTVAYSTKGQI